MKYIVYTNPDGSEAALLFCEHIEHRKAACLVGHRSVVSAGFVFFPVQNGQTVVKVCGRSESLNVDGRDRDAEIIAQQVNLDPAEECGR